jgi:rSAM/selenodomain-associated transferase 2
VLRLAVIVPVLADSEALAHLLTQLEPQSGVELTVVDGAADPALDRLLIGRPNARIVRSAAGRGLQMNAGAAASSAPLLLFLHADSRLPIGWDAALMNLPSWCVGGWFRFALEDDAWQARLIERFVGWRVRRLRMPYGDQGIFVRRDTFERLGGFREWPLMEDVDFARRLVAAGPVEEIPLPLRTSARLWRRDGWFRRSARNLVLITLYFAGVAPARLSRWYAAR